MNQPKTNCLFTDDPSFADLTPLPLPQDDSDPFYVTYSEEYKDLFGYFFALLAKEEISTRALKVTNIVISEYPSHYTAWWYKFHILEKLEYDLNTELQIINAITLKTPKSYQAWHYRQWLMDRAENDNMEQFAFLKKLFDKDAKNFHAWNFAIWYAKRWDRCNEMFDFIKYEIKKDVRNNSAWNARIEIGNELNLNPINEFEDAVLELKNVTKNEAVCNFLIAMYKKDGSLLERLCEVGNELVAKSYQNIFGYRLLLFVESRKQNNMKNIEKLCEKLMDIDPIRIPFYTLVKNGNIKYQ